MTGYAIAPQAAIQITQDDYGDVTLVQNGVSITVSANNLATLVEILSISSATRRRSHRISIRSLTTISRPRHHRPHPCPTPNGSGAIEQNTRP